ncbi:unnamed protein product [Lampetra fluviatilis]
MTAGDQLPAMSRAERADALCGETGRCRVKFMSAGGVWRRNEGRVDGNTRRVDSSHGRQRVDFGKTIGRGQD